MSTETFGKLLRAEREDRGLSIQAVAERIRVDPDVLEALERDNFEALPDERTMNACLEAYAECLEVEADLMIADYEEERDRSLQQREPSPAPPVASVEPVAAGPEPRQSARRLPWPAALVGLAIALVALWWIVARNGQQQESESLEASGSVAAQEVSSAAPVVEAPEPSAEPTPAVPSPAPAEPDAPTPAPEDQSAAETAPVPEVRTAPKAPPAREARRAPTSAGARLLTITDYGIGADVENRQLIGRTDRFTEGTQAWFWTRVQGGAPGSRIEHVWLKADVEQMRRKLRVDGPNWRTYTAFVLPGGSAGEWAVEARDESGQVLARSEFACVPR